MSRSGDFRQAVADARVLYQNRTLNEAFSACRDRDRWRHAIVVAAGNSEEWRFRVVVRQAVYKNGRFLIDPQAIKIWHRVESGSFHLDPHNEMNQSSLKRMLGSVIVEMLEHGWIFAPHEELSAWYAIEFVRKL